MYRIYYINRIAFKISKQLASYTPEMKTKKQKINNSASKKQNKSLDPMAPLGKQFQLLYRTCDKLPSSEQYQSVFFMKRKKISGEEQAPVQQKKAKKKKQLSKKKKFEEKIKVDEIGQTLFKKSQSLCATKSTMPSTLGLFKKSTFADTFKQKINLDKSALKKMNNLSNSNSSRYLTSKYTQKQKSPSKKFTSPSGKRLSKSPSKPLISSDNKISDKSIKSNKKLKSKFSKRISDKVSQLPTETTSNWKKSKNITKNEDFKQNVDQNFNQYVFIDGEYVQVQDPDCQALTEKITKYFGIGAPQVQPTYQSIHIRDDHGSNQFIDGFQANIIGLERKSSISHLRQSREQICLTEQSLTQTQKAEAEAQVLQKIIYIQRFWRAYIQRKTIEQCNNIKHFPSKAESQQSISDRASRNEQEQEDEDEDQNQNEFKDTLQQNKVNQCNSKSQKSLKQFIEMRQNLMLSHMQSEKDILNKMLELKKIDAGKYTQSLMQVESNFQTEMLEINKLKQKMVIQSERMEQLKIKLKQKSEIITKLEKLPANIVLEHFIEKPTKSHPKNSQSMQIIQSQFHRQKSNGYHYSELSEQAETETKHVSYRKSHPAPQSSTKSPIHVAETEKEEFQPSDQEADEDNQEQGSDMLSDAEKLSQLFQGFADHQIAQNQIQKRYAGQLGVGFQNSGGKQGSISTSVLSIHTFMTNFLKFYQYFYKDEFLKLINLPYGYNQKTRMKILQNYTSESWQTNNPLENEDDQTFFRIQQIIGQQIIEDFHEHNYQLPDNIDDNIKALIYFQKIHQKAIIHCFNQCLNCFRPYFFINGAPYIWNYSEKALTFYYIAQENIQEVFQKTQYKVLKIASSLCGAIVESLMAKPDTIKGMSLEQKLGKYRESVNPLLLENREQKLNKVEKQQIEEYNFRWEYFEEDKTSVLFNVAEAIYLELLLQIVQYQPLGNLSEDVSHYSSNSSETVISDKNQNNSHQSSASSSNNRIQATNEISVKHNKIAQHQNENQQGSANSEQQEPQIQKQNEENEGEDEEDEDEQEQQVQIQPLSFQRLQNWGRIAENKEQDQQEGEGDEQSQQKDEKYEQVQNSERKKRYYRQQYEKSEENEEEDQQNSQEQQEVHDGSEQRSQEQENSYENQEDQFEQQDEEEHAK